MKLEASLAQLKAELTRAELAVEGDGVAVAEGRHGRHGPRKPRSRT